MDIAYDEALEQIAQSVLATMLDIDSFRDLHDFVDDPEAVTAQISIRGGFDCEVLLRLAPDLARASAAAMFKLSPDDVVAEDVRDVSTELANMIGGNLKSLLPGPSKLALPRIQARNTSEPTTTTAKIVLATAFGPLMAAIYQDAATA